MPNQYFRCPYCLPRVCKNGEVVNKKVGRFRIKELSGNILILECQKCLKIFRMRYVGKPLLWDDLTDKEKKMFRKRKWVMYNELEKTN